MCRFVQHQQCVRSIYRVPQQANTASPASRLLESHDAFVYRLMQEKVDLGRGIDEEQQAIDKLTQAKTATKTLAELSGTKEVQDVQIGAQEEDLAVWKSVGPSLPPLPKVQTDSQSLRRSRN